MGNGNAYFTAAYSSPSSLETTGIRIDHSINDRFKLFGRFSITPSSITTLHTMAPVEGAAPAAPAGPAFAGLLAKLNPRGGPSDAP